MGQHALPYPVLWTKDDGVVQKPDDVLAAGTYYCDFGGDYAPWTAVQFVWDAAVAVTLTIEASNVAYSQAKVWKLNDEVWGLPVWDPVTAAGSLVIAAGAAGTDLVQLGGGAQRRFKAKAVVTTQGVVHVIPCHKA